MKDKERIILLQKKLAIAKLALKDIKWNGDGLSRSLAEEAEEKIENIEVTQG
jgi:hypothetical protein